MDSLPQINMSNLWLVTLKTKKKTVIGKSLGKNWLLSAFSNPNMPIPSPAPPHKRLWTRVFRIFFSTFKLIYGGGRDNWTIELFYEGIHNFR